MRRVPLTLLLSLAVLKLGAASVSGTADVQPTPTATIPITVIDGVVTDRSFTPDAQFAAWPHVNLEEAQRLKALHGVVFADARSKVEWDQAHIPGALPVPLGDFDNAYKQFEKKFKNARFIVVYCHGPGCHLSDMACKDFRAKGYKNVVNFYQGWPGWSDAKLPVEDKDGKITTPSALSPTASANFTPIAPSQP
jgi:rhodanese-related sulfurtransferase